MDPVMSLPSASANACQRRSTSPCWVVRIAEHAVIERLSRQKAEAVGQVTARNAMRELIRQGAASGPAQILPVTH